MSVKVLIINDETFVSNKLKQIILKIIPQADIRMFEDSEKVPSEAFFVDIIFTEVEMYGQNGFDIALKARVLNPRARVIFISSSEQYCMKAYENHIDGYILKPLDRNKVRKELDNLTRFNSNILNKVKAICFGNFEIFKNGIPLKFKRSKTKEMLAYLIDRRGAGVSLKELGAILYEDKEYDRTLISLIGNLKSDLYKTLENNDCMDIIIKSHNSIAIDVSKIDCDYFNFLSSDDNESTVNEYMSNYSWGEYTLSWLNNKQKK